MQHDFILLDRSGSMADGDRWRETLSSVNAYVKKLAEDKVDTGVTLATFDDHGGFKFEVIRDRIIPSTWAPVTDKEIAPRGGTPLNDAIAKIIAKAKDGFNGTAYDKLALIIMTDGFENASREHPGAVGQRRVKAMLDDCRAKGWQVIMLGADYDNMAQALSYGTVAAQSFGTASANLAATTDMLAVKRATYGATGQSITLSDDEKTALNQSSPTP